MMLFCCLFIAACFDGDNRAYRSYKAYKPYQYLLDELPHSPAPSGNKFLHVLLVVLRFKTPLALAQASHLVERSPHLARKTVHYDGSERRSLLYVRTVYGNAQAVCLKLHEQPVLCRSSVNAYLLQRNARLYGHSLHKVVHLIGYRLECSPQEVGTRRAEGIVANLRIICELQTFPMHFLCS